MPEIDFEIEWFMMTFNTLSSSRGSNGFGPNPISISEMTAYLSKKKLYQDLDTTIRILQTMDAEYMISYNIKNKD